MTPSTNNDDSTVFKLPKIVIGPPLSPFLGEKNIPSTTPHPTPPPFKKKSGNIWRMKKDDTVIVSLHFNDQQEILVNFIYFSSKNFLISTRLLLNFTEIKRP